MKMVANSIPTKPIAKQINVSGRLKFPGAANQRPALPATYMIEKIHIQRIRVPDVSARAPRIGARIAMVTPAPAMPNPHAACARVPSPRSSFRYGPKMKVRRIVL